MALEKSPEQGKLFKEANQFASIWMFVPRGLSRKTRLIRTRELSLSGRESFQVCTVHTFSTRSNVNDLSAKLMNRRKKLKRTGSWRSWCSVVNGEINRMTGAMAVNFGRGHPAVCTAPCHCRVVTRRWILRQPWTRGPKFDVLVT